MKKILFIIALVGMNLLLTEASAQIKTLYNSGFPTLTLATDTVVNTGTGIVRNFVPINSAAQSVTIQVDLLEISGTTAGTVSLLGSLDGVTYKALTIEEASTAIPTWTATDVTTVQTFIWRIKGNPVPYYAASWTGSGTMSATLRAKLLVH